MLFRAFIHGPRPSFASLCDLLGPYKAKKISRTCVVV